MLAQNGADDHFCKLVHVTRTYVYIVHTKTHFRNEYMLFKYERFSSDIAQNLILWIITHQCFVIVLMDTLSFLKISALLKILNSKNFVRIRVTPVGQTSDSMKVPT